MKKLLLIFLFMVSPAVAGQAKAASFQDLNTIAQDAIFRGRCLYALDVAAVNVMAEPDNTPGHGQRAAYATTVLTANVNTLQVALAVLTNPSISAEATAQSLPGETSVPDGDIQFTVNSLFNAFAGYAP